VSRSPKIPSHRMLAIRRGESEGLLMMRVHPPEDEALGLIEPLLWGGSSTRTSIFLHFPIVAFYLG
jgi:hypothetical protein